MISAKVIADSQNPFGDRITTMEVTMPRMILAEFNTHRMFSRNSASSRAIPFKKMVKMVKENPFIPLAWMQDHNGMQGSKYITSRYKNWLLRKLWLLARTLAVIVATWLNKANLTKQLCNRLLEPFMWHTVLVTATEWNNFFEQRCPRYEVVTSISKTAYTFKSRQEVLEFVTRYEKFDMLGWRDLDWLKINKGDAEIHMMAVAEAMYIALNTSTPEQLREGEWHLPYGKVDSDELENHLKGSRHYKEYNENPLLILIKIVVARCARLSYKLFGKKGKIDFVADIDLHDKLEEKKHWSPFEHCGKAMTEAERTKNKRSGNFTGFIQYRKTFKNENIN